MTRTEIINGLLGHPYRLGAGGPDEFDCYGLTRQLQQLLFGRQLPPFEIPGSAGRFALAAAISIHPERRHWHELLEPVDGAIVTMARNTQGYHMGTWIKDDAGLVVHTLEGIGVTVDTLNALRAIGWRNFRFHVPVQT